MSVALVIARADAGGLDHGFDVGVEGILGDGDAAGHSREAATDLGDHQVAGGELDQRVGGVDVPRAGGDVDGALVGLRALAGLGNGHVVLSSNIATANSVRLVAAAIKSWMR